MKDNSVLFGQQGNVMWRQSLDGQSPWGTWVETKVGWF